MLGKVSIEGSILDKIEEYMEDIVPGITEEVEDDSFGNILAKLLWMIKKNGVQYVEKGNEGTVSKAKYDALRKAFNQNNKIREEENKKLREAKNGDKV